MNYQIKGISPEMSNKILNYVNSRAKSPEERQAMINDMLPEAMEYEKQQKNRAERDSMKNQLRERISKETRGKEASQLQFWLRSAILSDMVRDHARKSGGNVKGLDNDEQLLNAFLSKNPDQAKTVERYLNGELSNLDIGKRFWFIKNGQTADIEQEIQTPGLWRQAWQIGEDIVGGVLDSVVGVPKLLGKGLGNAVARTAKKLGADKQKVDYLNKSWKDSLDGKNNLGLGTDIGQDTDSATYGITNTVADIAQVATPWGVVRAGGKGIQLVNTSTKLWADLAKVFPKTAKFINKTEKGADFVVWLLNKAGGKVDQLTQKAPLLWKMLKSGFDGASDMVLFNAVNGEGTDASEMWVGAWIGVAFPLVWKALWWVGKKAKNLIGNSASKLELNGILNPAKLETVQQQLITEGSMLPWKATPQDVGKWMLERGFKGSKGDIVNQLNAHAQKSRSLVDELLSLSNSTHKVNEVNEALEMLAKDYSTTPWLTNKADEILGMMKEEYSLSEMNKVKRHLDDAYNMFNKNWTETTGLKAEGLRNIRQTIKKTIEEVAESEGLGNIKMLNNETQIARGLADGIGRKDKADIVRELLSPFSSARNGAILGGIGGGATPNDSLPERIWNMAKWAIIGGILWSTKFKSNVANLLKNLGAIEKKEITQRIATNGATKLSEKSAKSLSPMLEKVIEEWDGNIDDLITNAQNSASKTFGNFKDIDIYSKNETFGRFTSPALKEKTVSGISRYTQEKIGILDQALRRYGHKWVKSEDFGASYLLPEVLDDPKLYEKYPQLKDTQIIFADFHTSQKRGLQAGGSIFINSKLYEKDPTNLRSTIVHEIQHIKQDIKGMSKVYDDADIRKLDQRYMNDPREIDARRKQQEYLDFVNKKEDTSIIGGNISDDYIPPLSDRDITHEIMQDVYRAVDNWTYKDIDTLFNKLDIEWKKWKLSTETINAIEKIKEEVYTMDSYQRSFFEEQSKKIMYNDEYWKTYEVLKKEAQTIEAMEQRIGKVWKNKVGKEYNNIQKGNREKKKEALIERIGEELWIDQFDAKDIYDSMI